VRDSQLSYDLNARETRIPTEPASRGDIASQELIDAINGLSIN